MGSTGEEPGYSRVENYQIDHRLKAEIDPKNKIMREAVCAFIRNEKGLILAVSRKDNPNDFGLPGGKVDPGETRTEALVREVYEETGLSLKPSMDSCYPIYDRVDGDFKCTTYLVLKYSGEIETTEKGVVKWTDFEELKRGSFGEYNADLEAALKRLMII